MTSRFSIRKAALQIAFLAVMVIFGACSNNSTGPTSASHIPSQGTTYKYRVYTTDTVGNVIVGSERTQTARVVTTNLIIFGKSDVVVVDFDQKGEHTYLHYEDNGDVSIAATNTTSTANRWVLLPYASRTTSTWASNENAGYRNIGDTAWYGGEDRVGLGAMEQDCIAAGYAYTLYENGSLASSSPLRIEEGYWYAPSIGFFPKLSIRNLNMNHEGNVSGGTTVEVWELVAIGEAP